MLHLKKNLNGLWMKENGGVLQHSVEIKPDKTLADEFFRDILHPHEVVIYLPETIFSVESEETNEQNFFILVLPVNRVNQNPIPVPLFMLNLTKQQKTELRVRNSVPNYAFNKVVVAVSRELPEESFDDGESNVEDEYLCVMNLN